LGLDVAGQPTLTVGTNLLAPLRRVKGKWRGRCVLSALLSLGLLGALAAVSGCATLGPTGVDEAAVISLASLGEYLWVNRALLASLAGRR